jgi:hypothetical protein
MRQVVVFVAAVMLLGATAWALSNDGMVDIYTNRLTTELGLSDQQTADVRAIMNTEIGKLRGIALKGGTPQRGKMQEVRELTDRTSKEIGEKLNDQQREKLTALAVPILPEMRLLELNDRLDLSATQVSQIDAILAANRLQRPPQAERNPGNREEFFKQMQENRAKTDTAIENVLTDQQKPIFEKMKQEQQEQMQQRRGNRPGGGGHFGGNGRSPF